MTEQWIIYPICTVEFKGYLATFWTYSVGQRGLWTELVMQPIFEAASVRCLISNLPSWIIPNTVTFSMCIMYCCVSAPYPELRTRRRRSPQRSPRPPPAARAKRTSTSTTSASRVTRNSLQTAGMFSYSAMDIRKVEKKLASCSSSGKKNQFGHFLVVVSADSQADAGRHQLYNNGSLVLFSNAWSCQPIWPLCTAHCIQRKIIDQLMVPP